MKSVTIKPSAAQSRVPMPGGYGLPAGSPLPADGFRVPHDEFVRRLIADGDVEWVKTADELKADADAAAAAKAATATTKAPAKPAPTSSESAA